MHSERACLYLLNKKHRSREGKREWVGYDGIMVWNGLGLHRKSYTKYIGKNTRGNKVWEG